MEGSRLEAAMKKNFEETEQRRQHAADKMQKKLQKRLRERHGMLQQEIAKLSSVLGAEFVASKEFRGGKLGYVFKKGAEGQGYYKDLQEVGRLFKETGARTAASAADDLVRQGKMHARTAETLRAAEAPLTGGSSGSSQLSKKKRTRSPSSDAFSRKKQKKKHRKHKKRKNGKGVGRLWKATVAARGRRVGRSEEGGIGYQALLRAEAEEDGSSSEDDGVGPKPMEVTNKLAHKNVDYGFALRPGEGEAIAQFVQEGKRIPRRGEASCSHLLGPAAQNEAGIRFAQLFLREARGEGVCGLSVMKCHEFCLFGHRKMNAIRIRKENQVYSAEEQRALAMINYEERAARESQLIYDLREMLKKQNEALFSEELAEAPATPAVRLVRTVAVAPATSSKGCEGAKILVFLAKRVHVHLLGSSSWGWGNAYAVVWRIATCRGYSYQEGKKFVGSLNRGPQTVSEASPTLPLPRLPLTSQTQQLLERLFGF
ncbi:nuclear NF-kb activating protein [Cyclospora cayetanensis]|uniref:Nuclear NF-kb activating protein n=1 Tax=Cyclospora cayetanensis TaxID=88456 RepID=A0A1D3D210_9EIME|nr:nuclear NF-kb activating protein [Cyclospora cayetanensis]